LGRRARPRLRRLDAELARLHPDLENLKRLVIGGSVVVDGRPVTNPASLVPVGASIVVRPPRPLRGEARLRAALTAFGVSVRGRVALDAGAAAGGFTRVLLEAGAGRVYAVDAGHGQLLGSLRQDDRVVVLEGVNLGALSRALVPDRVDVLTLDLSYLAVALAAPQLDNVDVAPDADLLALVKPMFELRLARPPTDDAALRRAVDAAARALAHSGWHTAGVVRSPEPGSRGAREFLVHARRAPGGRRRGGA
jgi:23S rRNA (cytidine1920-2'-O)/16S rRNA (cytidine1409-2'-O)-methyltransferase